jgi:hypothetical protein
MTINTITVYGASDDLIEVEGDIREEFNFNPDDDDDHRLLAFSDGTLLRARYDQDGLWRFEKLAQGQATMTKVEGSVDDDTGDRVTLCGEIKWVALATHAAYPGRRGS